MRAHLSNAVNNLLEVRNDYREDINNRINNLIFKIECSVEYKQDKDKYILQDILDDVNDLNYIIDDYCKILKSSINDVIVEYNK